ncbi:MAG: WHG domain-containing protein [Oscillospiraceae bacterium]|nr:WHG domain-containing protein [Oscillospiraceae bacterium]
MPPKQKFSREEIIAASLNITRREGLTGLTARGLGAELKSSARPIFTIFKNMEEVHQETIKAAKAIYSGYVQKGLEEEPAFKGVGTAYVHFSKDEPKLFQLLFMTEKNGISTELSDILPAIDENSNRILESVQKYGMSKEKSYKLYQYLWLFTHGIATLYATGVCRFTDKQVSEMLTEVFVSILRKMKEESEVENDD